jgi:F-type H+/Na+-transporting ATPase subunit alpha
MEEAVVAFKKLFKSSVAAALNEAPVDALDGEDAESVTRYVQPAVKK